jgi:CBS domain containing-hemolysin-like protein
MTESRTLQLYPLPLFIRCFEPHQDLSVRVSDDSPAILVMTDLRQQVALTVEPNLSIDWTMQRMKSAGVHLLFVVNGAKQVLGVITSSDIQGEKPLQFRQHLNLRHEEIMVRDIMTPHANLEAMRMEDVLHSTVGDIVVTLTRSGRRHALVMDENLRSGEAGIRGIFSLSQIGNQLGRALDTSEVAHTFAEVELALNG